MKDIDHYENMEINYLELAYISGRTNNDKFSRSYARQIFRNVLGFEIEDPIKRTDLVKVKDLYEFFKPIYSVDPRFDKMNSLLFFMMNKSRLYKRYLSNKGVIAKGALLGGKVVLYKIMSEDEIKTL